MKNKNTNQPNVNTLSKIKANCLQQGFIFHYLNGSIDTYVIQTELDILTHVDVDLFRTAWEYALSKYPALRLRFDWSDDINQIIESTGSLDFRFIDLSNCSIEDRERGIIKEEKEKEFDLSKSPLFRVTLICEEYLKFKCVFTCHHAIMDSDSIKIVLNYILNVYDQLAKKNSINENEDKAYCYSQIYLENNIGDNQVYWKKKIDSIDEKENLSSLLKPGLAYKYDLTDHKTIGRTKEKYISFEKKYITTIRSFCEENEISIDILMQYAWHKLLNIYTNNEISIVGTVCSSKNLPIDGLDQSVGLFINTIPLIFEHTQESVIKTLKRFKQILTEATFKSNINLASLQTDGKRLFNTLYTYDNRTNIKSNILEDDLPYIIQESKVQTEYPINFTVIEYKDKLDLQIEYDSDIICNNKITDLISGIKIVINDIIDNPYTLTTNLKTIPNRITNKLLYTFNQTHHDYSDKSTIINIFKSNVLKYPDDIAIVYENVSYTYKQLDIETNKLSNYLISKFTINPEDRIALLLNRSHYIIIAMLAILKTRAAYVPMSPAYPKDRITFILNDSNAKIVITDNNNEKQLNTSVNVVNIEDSQLWDNYGVEKTPQRRFKSSDLAYLIYTSGTTGNPKGVMIENKSVVNLITYLLEKYDFKTKQNILLFAEYVFDASMEQIYLSLFSGNKLIIIRDKIWLDNELFMNVLNQNEVTYIDMTNSFLLELNFESIVHLKYIVSGGEAATNTLLEKIDFKKYNFINTYGPTETTITSILNINSKNIHIGFPVGNTSAYILNEYLEILPVGTIGELFISGEGVSRGYNNLPEQTEKRFIKNPFQSKEDKEKNINSRLYKTGDLVRYLPNGELEYIGRNDFQIKIRGYRVELGEIENVISSIPEIKNNVVICDQNASKYKYLVAYYVSESKLDEEYIKSSIKTHLPEYMLPTHYVYLDKMPLTISGKINRTALPKVVYSNKEKYIAPTDECQKNICKIYSEVLGLDENIIGIEDDFFKLGGDSISSIQLVNRIRKYFNVKITVNDIFNNKTIRRIANLIGSSNFESQSILSEQGLLNGELKLLPIQKWFFDMAYSGYYKDKNHYNQSFVIGVPSLDIKILSISLKKLLEYHDILRVKYIEDSHIKQLYTDIIPTFNIETVDINAYDAEQLNSFFTKKQKELDINKGNLFNIVYLSGFSDGRCELFFAIHHLVIDSVSWRIIKEDLEKLYTHFAKEPNSTQINPSVILGEKGSSYRQWTEAISLQYPQKYDNEIQYWKNYFREVNSWNNGLTTSSAKWNTYNIELDYTLTENILRDVNNKFNTSINDVLLAALSKTLEFITKSLTNYVLLEGHGRENVFNDIDCSNTVGWFTSMYPVKLECHPNDIVRTIIDTKEFLSTIPRHGIGYGALSNYKITDLPKISFNYLGQFEDSGLSGWKLLSHNYGSRNSDNNNDFAILSITGFVYNNRMGFRLEGFLDNTFIKKIGDLYHYNLELLTNTLLSICIIRSIPTHFPAF